MSQRPELPPELVDRLGAVRSAGVITGAGISAASGIPTYRGAGGLYDDPEEGDRTVEALSGPTLRSDPDRTWRVVAELARRAEAAEPNAAHRALVALEEAVERFVLLTQNVDGLHRQAGSRNVIEIHGDVFATRCMACDRPGRLDREALAALDRAPACPDCGGTLRPDAVLFGEMLPTEPLARLQAELLDDVPDLVLVTGTTAIFPYIAQPVLTAARFGRLVVEVNPERTSLSELADVVLEGPAETWLPSIAAAVG